MKIILNKKEQDLLNKLTTSVSFTITKTDSRGIVKKITGKNLGKNTGFTDMRISLPHVHQVQYGKHPEKHIYFCSKEVEKALKELLVIYNAN